MTSFTQTLEVRVGDEAALRDHLAAWDAAQAADAPGYAGARLLADLDDPGRYVVVVGFTSREDAERNSARPETAAWADRLRQLADGEPVYGNHAEVYASPDTVRRAG